MFWIDENTSRADLETAAFLECGFAMDVIKNATDGELLEMVRNWIEEGDECAGS